MNNTPHRLHGDDGQTMAEYSVVLALITLAIVMVLTALGAGIGQSFTQLAALL